MKHIEYLDVLYENGNLTGQRKPRDLVHKDGDWHRAVHVWIMNSNNDILMQKRSPQKESHPDEWDISYAGHVGAGSTSMKTAIREAKEELGLNVSETDLKFLFCKKNQSVLNKGTFINNEHDDVYLLRKDLDLSKIKLQKEEVSEVKWFTLDDLRQILHERRQGFVIHEEEYLALLNLAALKIMSKHKKPTEEAKMLRDALKKRGVLVYIELYDGFKHVDLALPKARLDVEVDGIQHLTDPHQIVADLARGHYSHKDGYDTMHIMNETLHKHIEKIADALAEASKIRDKKLNIHLS